MSLCQTHAATQCKQAAQDKDTSVASVLGQQPLFALASRCPPQLLLLEYLLQRVSYDLLGALEETFHMDTWPSCLHSCQRPSRHCPYELSRTLGPSPLTQHAVPEVLCVTHHPMSRGKSYCLVRHTPPAEQCKEQYSSYALALRRLACCLEHMLEVWDVGSPTG